MAEDESSDNSVSSASDYSQDIPNLQLPSANSEASKHNQQSNQHPQEEYVVLSARRIKTSSTELRNAIVNSSQIQAVTTMNLPDDDKNPYQTKVLDQRLKRHPVQRTSTPHLPKCSGKNLQYSSLLKQQTAEQVQESMTNNLSQPKKLLGTNNNNNSNNLGYNQKTSNQSVSCSSIIKNAPSIKEENSHGAMQKPIVGHIKARTSKLVSDKDLESHAASNDQETKNGDKIFRLKPSQISFVTDQSYREATAKDVQQNRSSRGQRNTTSTVSTKGATTSFKSSALGNLTKASSFNQEKHEKMQSAYKINGNSQKQRIKKFVARNAQNLMQKTKVPEANAQFIVSGYATKQASYQQINRNRNQQMVNTKTTPQNILSAPAPKFHPRYVKMSPSKPPLIPLSSPIGRGTEHKNKNTTVKIFQSKQQPTLDRQNFSPSPSKTKMFDFSQIDQSCTPKHSGQTSKNFNNFDAKTSLPRINNTSSKFYPCNKLKISSKTNDLTYAKQVSTTKSKQSAKLTSYVTSPIKKFCINPCKRISGNHYLHGSRPSHNQIFDLKTKEVSGYHKIINASLSMSKQKETQIDSNQLYQTQDDCIVISEGAQL